MADRYVSTDGNDSDGLTWVKAYNTIAQAVADPPSSGEFIYIDSQTFAESVDMTALAGVTIQGGDADGEGFDNDVVGWNAKIFDVGDGVAEGTPMLDLGNGCTAQNLYIKHAKTPTTSMRSLCIDADGSGGTWTNVTISNCWLETTGVALRIKDVSGFVIENVVAHGGQRGGYFERSAVGKICTGTITDCFFEANNYPVGASDISACQIANADATITRCFGWADRENASGGAAQDAHGLNVAALIGSASLFPAVSVIDCTFIGSTSQQGSTAGTGNNVYGIRLENVVSGVPVVTATNCIFNSLNSPDTLRNTYDVSVDAGNLSMIDCVFDKTKTNGSFSVIPGPPRYRSRY